MTFLNEALDRIDPFVVRRKPLDEGLPPTPLATIARPPDPGRWLLDAPARQWPATQLDYLRTLFFREIFQDRTTGCVFETFIHSIRTTVSEKVTALAAEKCESFWRTRAREIKERGRDERKWMVLGEPSPEEDVLEDALVRLGSEYTERVIEVAVAQGPRPEDFRSSIDELVPPGGGGNEDWLKTLAEEAFYRLGIASLPHEWLTQMMILEGQLLLLHLVREVRPYSRLDSFMFLSDPAWRTEEPPSKPRPSVTIRLFADEPDEEHSRKIDEARERIRGMRVIRKGPKSWRETGPRDDELIHLLYRHLCGETYQQLANNNPAARRAHTKTLQDHLRQLRAEIFSAT